MKPSNIAGMVLIVVGVVALLAGGFRYTKKEKVIDVGPVEATVERHERVAIPPILGGLFVAAGVVLLFVGRRSV
jgi:uncharacterized membrane protein YidH (DUF202 family)